MKSDTALDFAVFQLSPRRSRCELFVSGDGKTEKLASGLLKPFVTHLTVAEEQVAQHAPSIKLEVKRRKNEGVWFTKGTLERFVRFVSTPDVLELVIKLDAEMSQLEAARKIYLQGAGNPSSSPTGGDGLGGTSTSADTTKKELLRAIDLRLVAVQQDLTTACARASSAGFTTETVSELQLFAHRFGAHRLSEACAKFIMLSQKRTDLVNPWKVRADDQALRSSFDSDMSIDDQTEENTLIEAYESLQYQQQPEGHYQRLDKSAQETHQDQNAGQSHSSLPEQANLSIAVPAQHSSGEPNSKMDEGKGIDGSVKTKDEDAQSESPQITQPSRRLSVQDRINLFENKQKEQTTSSGGKVVVGKSVELRRLSSDVSSAGQAAERAVLRRWSGASDMSMDLSSDKKDTESSASTPCSTSNSVNQTSIYPSASISKDKKVLSDTATSSMSKLKEISSTGDDSRFQDQSVSENNNEFSGKEEGFRTRDQNSSEMQPITFSGRSKDLTNSKTESRSSFDNSEGVGLKELPESHNQLKVSSVPQEDSRWRSQVPAESYIQLKSSMGRSMNPNLRDQGAYQYQPLNRTFSDVTGNTVTKDHISSLANFRSYSTQLENVVSNDRTASDIHSEVPFSKVDDVGSADETSQAPIITFPEKVEISRSRQLRASQSKVVDVGLKPKDRSAPKQQTRDLTRNMIGDSRTKDQATYQGERNLEGDLLAPQFQWNSFPGKSDHAAKKDALPSQVQASVLARVDGSTCPEIKLQRPSSVSEQSNMLPGRKGETDLVQSNSDPLLSRRKVIVNQDVYDSVSTPTAEQTQKPRLSKGNQELNEELQNKANDLEKLFAAHKLRVTGDQPATVRRSKPADIQAEPVANRKPVEVTPLQLPKKGVLRKPLGSSGDLSEHGSQLSTRIIDSQDHGNIPESHLEKSRGKLYDMYVQKRDAKLKEEWSSSRGQKEAKLKAMQDYLESSSAEMKEKFSWSADRQDSVQNARRRAEKLRSFNIRSAMKIREQTSIGFLHSEEDADVSEFPDQTQYTQEKFLGETVPGDGSSRSTLSKRLSNNRTTFSSTPRTSATQFSRSVKPSYSHSERRRAQAENPLAQSVPNFSDLRKENTKPSSPGISKLPTRPHARGNRSKSISEDLPFAKEDKPRRSQSMRKNSTGPEEMKDLPSLLSEGSGFPPFKVDNEQTEQGLYNRVHKNGESKPFLRKGNGIRPGAGASIARLKASVTSQNLKTEEESDDSGDQFEDSVEMIEGEIEESEAVANDLKSADYSNGSDNEKPVSKESIYSGDTELDNKELLRSLSSVDHDLADEVAAVVPSMFHSSVGPVQDSPGESPASWNLHGHHPFSYVQETSDVDGFAESPMGSPASWNSHSLTQIEADAARMRKKWGNAQKTILVSNTSNHQTRKDVTKGFKRLLKFGRKSRGTESLADWISATTSEGDDDTEDGSDIANRSSEDLRKSRMGYSHDGFNDGELFNEQVQALRTSIPTPPANFKLREEHLSGSSLKAPRSFFSLSSFRSKGSESKPR